MYPASLATPECLYGWAATPRHRRWSRATIVTDTAQHATSPITYLLVYMTFLPIAIWLPA